MDQGQYPQARKLYEDALSFVQRLGDPRSHAVIEGQLGVLAVAQHDYTTGQARYLAALHTFQELEEPFEEAKIWYQLGRVAEEQRQWVEAERRYRASLALNERLGNTAGAARACNQLALVAEVAGRPAESEGWYRRALERDEQAHPGNPDSDYLHNFAAFLVNEVSAGRAATTRLAEAKRHAEQALVLKERLEASAHIWATLGVLAKIAEMEGQVAMAQYYRRRMRETFAAFAGHRYHLDRLFGLLIPLIVAATQGDGVAQATIEAKLPEFEARGWKIADAVRHIWAGERDWHTLVKDLANEEALFILRVLEAIAVPEEPFAQPTPEAFLISLPTPVLDALQQGDQTALAQALAALPPAEYQRIQALLQVLQERTEDRESEQGM